MAYPLTQSAVTRSSSSTETKGQPATDDAMRKHCLAMHEEIRRSIRVVLELAARAMTGDGSVALPLERAMQELAYSVRRHVVAEERDADCSLKKLETWGDERRRLLAADHEKEVEALFNVEYYGSHLAMAQDAAGIANDLLAALRHEEEVALPAASGGERA